MWYSFDHRQSRRTHRTQYLLIALVLTNRASRLCCCDARVPITGQSCVGTRNNHRKPIITPGVPFLFLFCSFFCVPSFVSLLLPLFLRNALGVGKHQSKNQKIKIRKKSRLDTSLLQPTRTDLPFPKLLGVVDVGDRDQRCHGMLGGGYEATVTTIQKRGLAARTCAYRYMQTACGLSQNTLRRNGGGWDDLELVPSLNQARQGRQVPLHYTRNTTSAPPQASPPARLGLGASGSTPGRYLVTWRGC